MSVQKPSSGPNPVPSLLPTSFPLRLLFLGLIPAILALIEIQFAPSSYHLFYGFLNKQLNFLDAFFKTADHFVGELTISAIVVIVWVHNPRARHTIAPYLIALLIASTICSGIKLTSGRARPKYGVHMDDKQRVEIAEYLRKYENPVLKPERGDYWLWFSKDRPGLEFLDWFSGKRPWFDRVKELSTGDYSAFPSGHTTSAFLLALYLALLYPRTRWLWYLLATLTACARIVQRMHHPGDVLFGGSLGWLTGCWVFSSPWAASFGYAVQRRVESVIGRGPAAD